MSMANINIGDKVLVTTDNWFFAPDGQQYRAVYGTVHGIYSAEEVLGIKPNAKSTNWYAVIGNMTLAGCQIHYAIKSDTCTQGECKAEEVYEGKFITSDVRTRIYFAD